MVRVAMVCVTAAVIGLMVFMAGGQEKKEVANPNLGKVRHVVIFKFKDSATPEQIKQVEEAFRALPAKIPQIREMEWGTNISPENLAAGFTHCFFLTFDDEKARDAYLPHPAHKEFGKSLGPVLDKVLVIDYKAK